MNKQFNSLILFPTIFIVSLLGVLTASKSYVAFFMFLLITLEQIYNWNKSIQSNQRKDYRLFFTEQYLNVIYLLTIFPLYLISIFFWEQINFWILFGYGFNYLIFRSIAKTGVDQLSSSTFSNSKEIKSTLESWKSNKKKLSGLLQRNINNNLKETLLDKLNYSSFLNSENASILLDQAADKKGKELENILKLINDQM